MKTSFLLYHLFQNGLIFQDSRFNIFAGPRYIQFANVAGHYHEDTNYEGLVKPITIKVTEDEKHFYKETFYSVNM